MNSIVQWMKDNPTLAFFVIWPLVSMIVNGFFDWIKLHKSDNKFALLANAFFETVGLDASGLIKALQKIFGGPPVPPGSVAWSRDAQTDPPKSPPPAAARMALRRRATAWAMVPVMACATLFQTGCSWFHDTVVPALNKIIIFVTDAAQALSILEGIAQLFFMASPDPVEQQRFALADKKCHEALDALTKLADAGKSLDDQDVQAAIADFQQAYADLESLMKAKGMRVPERGSKYSPLLLNVHTEKK